MAFGKTRNRRRQDTAQKKEAVKGVVRTHGVSVAKGLLAAVLTAGLVWGGVELRSYIVISRVPLCRKGLHGRLARVHTSHPAAPITPGCGR